MRERKLPEASEVIVRSTLVFINETPGVLGCNWHYAVPRLGSKSSRGDECQYVYPFQASDLKVQCHVLWHGQPTL